MGGSFAVKERPWWERWLDYLYVPSCPGCGLVGQYGLCAECAGEIKPLKISFGASFAVYAAGWYSGALKNALLRCKKAEQTYLTYDLVRHMLSVAVYGGLCSEPDWKGSICVPIPPDPKRYRKRGFHCPDLLARELCRQFLGWHYQPKLLQLTRSLKSQKLLSRYERFLNVQGAYQVVREIRGESILLIDDVITTGATLIETARAMFRAGAVRVAALTAVASAHLERSGFTIEEITN